MIEYKNNLFIILDIETTGLSPSNSEITEIAAIKVNRNFEIVEEFEKLIKIDNEVPKHIIRINGISNKLLNKKGIVLNKALIELSDFCEDIPIHAHNAKFDKSFIIKALDENQIKHNISEWIDTIKVIKQTQPYLPSYKLSYLVSYYNTGTSKHRGLSDAINTLNVIRASREMEYEKNSEIEPEAMISQIVINIQKNAFNKTKSIKKPKDDFFKNYTSNLPFISLTRLLKIKFLSMNFINSVDKFNTQKIIRGSKQKFDLTIGSQIVGTIADQVIEYLHDKKTYIKKIQSSNKLSPGAKKFFANRKSLDEWDFHIIGYEIHFFRSGEHKWLERSMSLASNKDVFSGEDSVRMLGHRFGDSINDVINEIKKQMINLKNKSVEFNPVFGNITSGIKADGDLIIDGNLCEVKTSRKPSFLKSYNHQLIAYILLNKEFDIGYQLSEQEVVYWNPKHNIYMKKDIVINKEIIDEFYKMLIAGKLSYGDNKELLSKLSYIKSECRNIRKDGTYGFDNSLLKRKWKKYIKNEWDKLNKNTSF